MNTMEEREQTKEPAGLGETDGTQKLKEEFIKADLLFHMGGWVDGDLTNKLEEELAQEVKTMSSELDILSSKGV